MGKIIITGSGRAGSTFLVQLMTRLGFDTGLEPYKEVYDDDVRAGCEWAPVGITEETSIEELRSIYMGGPRIQKAPAWAFSLKTALYNKVIDIDHIILPIRDIDASAKSRLDVGLDWLMDDDLVGEQRLKAQANVHAMAIGRTIEAAILFQIPLTIFIFPKFVQDKQYCFKQLKKVFPELQQLYHYNGQHDQFGKIYDELANPEMIKWG